MNKKILFLLILFMAGTLLWANPGDTVTRLVFFTREIVSDIQNSRGNFNDLKYYLSAPFSIVVEQDNTSKSVEINEGALVRGQNIPVHRIEFTVTDAGTLRTIESTSGSFVITFKDTPLRFRRNSQGRYDLVSAEIDSNEYIIYPPSEGRRLPQLCISQRANEEVPDSLELLAVPDSGQGYNHGRTDNVQQPAYRDSSRQAYQTVKINAPARSSSGRPSRNIDGPSYVHKRCITAYVIRQNPSVNRDTLNRLIDTYISEAEFEGINLDIAIAQMLYATNFLGNQQRMTTHNYGGLSDQTFSWNGRFYTMTEGVRAHIQHLKGYVSTRLNGQLVDPRYYVLVDLGYRGNIRMFEDLFRVWTESSARYENRINEILNGLYWFSVN